MEVCVSYLQAAISIFLKDKSGFDKCIDDDF